MEYHSIMYLRASASNKAQVTQVRRFIQRLNLSLKSSSNLLLMEPVEMLKHKDTCLLVVPLFIGVPLVFFPFFYFPKIVYFFAILISFKFQHKIKGIKLRLVTSLFAAGVMYEKFLGARR